MTLVVAWVGIQADGPTSMTLASDSRMTNGATSFDYVRKLYTLKSFPDIFGYCGDVLFPSIVLGQIVEMADNGLLFTTNSSCEEKFENFANILRYSLDIYPKNILGDDNFQIIHASRENHNNKSFFCRKLVWNKTNGWSEENVEIPEQSGLLFAIGTGADDFRDKYKIYENGLNQNTSRNVYHCFSDTISSNKSDPTYGGPSQVVGIYRKDNARIIGTISNKKRYFLGAELKYELTDFNRIEWRNELFERCDGNTMELITGAQRQPNPII